MKRLSLNEQDAAHVYEWLRMYWRDEPSGLRGCAQCAQIGGRLERFIGTAAVRRTARVVRDSPKKPGLHTIYDGSRFVVLARMTKKRGVIDPENPPLTAEDFAQMRPALDVMPPAVKASMKRMMAKHAQSLKRLAHGE